MEKRSKKRAIVATVLLVVLIIVCEYFYARIEFTDNIHNFFFLSIGITAAIAIVQWSYYHHYKSGGW